MWLLSFKLLITKRNIVFVALIENVPSETETFTDYVVKSVIDECS